MKARYLIPFGIFALILAIFVLGLLKMEEDANFECWREHAFLIHLAKK